MHEKKQPFRIYIIRDEFNFLYLDYIKTKIFNKLIKMLKCLKFYNSISFNLYYFIQTYK